jgi:antitoxin (DNA-binding transcriptional repressor) of toxin-antitoxin stability system
MTSRAKPLRPLRSSQKQKQRAGLPSTGRRVRQAALAEVKDDLSRFLRLAESEEILITRHGKPAGGLIGFEREDDWIDYRLERGNGVIDHVKCDGHRALALMCTPPIRPHLLAGQRANCGVYDRIGEPRDEQ